MRSLLKPMLYLLVMTSILLIPGCAKTSPIASNTPDSADDNDADAISSEVIAGTVNGEKLDIVKVPGGTNPADKRYDDVIEALKIALEKTVPEYGDYQLIISSQAMTGNRFVEEVKSGENVNVIWRTYSPELSKELTPIYIDPRKGLLGYRLFLIRKEDQDKFAQIMNLADLQKFTVGQGQDWMDIAVFKHNQIEVITGSDYEGLFKMLINKRFDYFSRGMGEIFTEYEDRKESLPDMQIETELVLYYPWPYFYYVNPNEERIAKRIEKGLNIMIQDGSMDALFNKYNHALIEKAHIKTRRLLIIENPLMKDAPFDMTDKSRWFDPKE